ncbi:MAG: NlpC/P60 family protein [Terrimicrobiaceae bacterium]|nr:NlpC/P60 family protein [Terrimicrobiaceae bacterium]
MKHLLALALLVTPALAQDRIHVVRPGDTLAKLMWIYGVSGDAILHENGLSSPDLRPCTRLAIPTVSEAPRAEPVATARAEPVPVPEAAPQSNGFAEAIAIPAAQNVRYNGRWVPPGEPSPWVMDCSNTSRWLYREVRGIELPRTASDQYEWLRARHRLWRARPDAASLRRRLQTGDLLFWENTYRPERRPPVTHVMLFLGTDERGRMMMAGSQGASGPDTYEFQPAKKMGGYRFFFFFRRDGRFVAYGRP